MRVLILMIPVYMYMLIDLSTKGVDIMQVDLSLIPFIAFVVVLSLLRKVIR